jgi:cobalt-zinc-cadmium efflux system membrane fusion protein
LTRLGDQVDRIGFSPEGDFLRGDTVVYEPHSFIVAIDARLDGKSHRFEYDNFEGRTRIGAEMAAAFGVQTEIAGPAELEETVRVYGRVVPNADRMRAVSARFDGLIVSTHAGIGDAVRAGQRLLSIESNESLQPYTIDSPIDGIVTARTANPGEQTDGRQLFTVIDPSSVWVELAIFPADRERVRAGAPVSVSNAGGDVTRSGTIDRVHVVANANQAVTARVVLDNSDGRLPPGTYVQARIVVDRYTVPLAVRQSGLQSFRDFTVVYAQIGDEYEVRMLDLGRQDNESVEVLGGLEPGTRYVSENSYVVKADIEKSGASHDH